MDSFAVCSNVYTNGSIGNWKMSFSQHINFDQLSLGHLCENNWRKQKLGFSLCLPKEPPFVFFSQRHPGDN